MQLIKVETHLNVRQEGNTVVAVVEVRNDKPFPIVVEKRRTGKDKDFFLNVFQISTGDGRVPFRGPVGKLPAPQAADFITIAKGQSLSFKIDLGKYYEFPKGAKVYKFRYQTSVIPLNGQDLFEFSSNEVLLSLQL